MKSLAAERDYENAVQIADSINWRKIKNVNALVKAGEIYEKVGRYEESKEILLMAYDRSPIGRMIIYQLAEVAIKTKNFSEAKEYYDEFVEIAPHDNLKYVLKYEINKAQGADVRILISILEELKAQEYSEEWAYELAYLYHKAGMSDKCIEACDELILWFGDGDYVEKSLELKMLYQPLTKQQEDKYRKFRQKREGVVEVRPEDELESGEIVTEPMKIKDVKMSAERFNTQNLQEELQKSMQQIMEATEKETVDDSMDNIKKLVEEIPFLQIQHEKTEPEEELEHIETDKEIDGSLKLNFQEMLGEEYDGQMNLNVPEKAMIESQITGQMSIEDVLAEWERTKRAAEAALQEAEQRRLESAKQRALQEAGDIMERLADVIPKLDSGITPKELLEEQYMNGEPMEDDEAAAMVANMNQILQEEIDRLSEENEQMDEQLAAVEAASVADYAAQARLGLGSSYAAKAALTSAEIAALTGMNASTEEVTELKSEDDYEESFEDDDEDEFVEDLNSEEVDENIAEYISAEEELRGDDLADKFVAGIDAERVEVIEDAFESEESSEEASDESSGEEDELAALEAELDLGAIFEDKPKQETAELPKIAMPEGIDAEFAEEIEVTKEASVVETKGTITKLSKEQRAAFTYFVPIAGMERQLCQAMSGVIQHQVMSSRASTGNLIIQGGSGSGKTVLATNFVKVLQKETGKLKGKVGKIEASVLNKKDVAELLTKVSGGCLIIEKAGNLSRETAMKLSSHLEKDSSGLLVIIEDTKQGIEKALSKDEGFASKFSEKIDIPIFTSDELVVFAKSYANELGYTIDEMGVLALYNSISNIQKIDRETTLAEVKEIVDEAVRRVEKGAIKKAFRMLTSRRYDEDDYVILREKDFNIL